MELKPGYKQTDIGIIPDEWEVTTVGDQFSVQLGKMIDAEKNFGILKPYLGNRAVQWGRIVLDEIGSVRLTQSDLQRFFLEEGDLLVCEGGEVGRAAIWHRQLEECYFQKALHRLRPLQNYNIALMQNVLLHLVTGGLLNNFVTQTSIAHLPKDKFLTVPIPLPPITEQNAIAEALNDVDDLIESLEQLIAKKRQIKLGSMEKLFSGRIRLPGFTDDWTLRKIGEFADCIAGGTPSTGIPAYWGGNICWMNSGELNFRSIYDVEGRITETGLKNSSTRLVPPDCVLVGLAGQGRTRGTVAINFIPLCTNQSIAAILPNPAFVSRYLYYNLDLRYEELRELSAGDGGRGGLNLSIIRAIEVPFPSLPEQTAIASVLAEKDEEITLIQTKLYKARQIKQGMLQELLTGRIRLVQPESNVVSFPMKGTAATTASRGHNSAINEAVIISVLAKNFGSEQWPLGRKRYTKLSYLLHRHAEGQVEGYLKKAAGPYNPSTKYKGAEKIALANKYVRSHARDNFSGFVAAEKIAEAEGYFSRWYGEKAISWLEQFRFKKNDDLELLATVDMAVVNLNEAGVTASVAGVKQYIHDVPEWTAKLDRPIFSDANIDEAIKWSRKLFEPAGGE